MTDSLQHPPVPTEDGTEAPIEFSTDDPGEALLIIIRDLSAELHPGRKTTQHLSLDSSLDKDLGFDSLGRAELLLRAEKHLAVKLNESLLAEVETPRQLLEAIIHAAPETLTIADAAVKVYELSPSEGLPENAQTLPQVLEWHAARHPDRPHITLSKGYSDEEVITYGQLAERAKDVARGLVAGGLKPGDRAAIMLPTSDEFFYAFFGILYAGGVPVPIYPPVRLSQLEDHLRRQAVILNNAGAAVLVTVKEARRLAILLKSQVAGLRSVDTVTELRARDGADLPVVDDTNRIAFLQYTSGSTGDPKGVVLTHANLLANVRGMGHTIDATSADVFISWLPLYHDMGLIGAWLATQYFAVPTVIMSPLTFLARPASWLWAIHRHKGTLSAAPNFAFELCLNKVSDEDAQGLDLSSLRMVANGAEPIAASTIRRFTERFAPYGFKPEALAPVYGLAESSVGVAFPPEGRAPIIDRIDRRALTEGGVAEPAADDDLTALECVACGRPMPGHQIRVVDDTGREVADRRQGRLQFRGPSSTSGYYNNPEKTKALFDGDWLETGDLAYIAGGDVFFTGRVKDMIIRAGRNIYPAEIESAVGDVDGVRKGCVAVFGSPDPHTAKERLVVLAETRITDEDEKEAIRDRIVAVCAALLDAPPDDVVLGPPQTVPKTSSGKIRRTSSRELYESGRIGSKPRAVWRQVAGLALTSLKAQLSRAVRIAGEYAYAGWWWLSVVLTAVIVWPSVLVLPTPKMRWGVLRGAAKTLFAVTGTRITLEGADNVAPGVVVANHASYIDGLMLAAVWPGSLRFVAKRELKNQFIAGPFLSRLGTVFAERFDTGKAVDSKQRALDAAKSGDSLVFFPEGTLTRRPGLMEFRLGAFLVAAESGMPVTPVTLHGNRSVLRGDQWFPRHGHLSVTISPPISPRGSDWAAAVHLRDSARAEILYHCGEPDLTEEKVLF